MSCCLSFCRAPCARLHSIYDMDIRFRSMAFDQINQIFLFDFAWKCANLRKLQLEMVELFFCCYFCCWYCFIAEIKKTIEHVNSKSFDILLLLPLILYLFSDLVGFVFHFYFIHSSMIPSMFSHSKCFFFGLFIMSGLNCIRKLFSFFFFICKFAIRKSLQMSFTFFKHRIDWNRQDWKSMTASVWIQSTAIIMSTYAIVK